VNLDRSISRLLRTNRSVRRWGAANISPWWGGGGGTSVGSNDSAGAPHQIGKYWTRKNERGGEGGGDVDEREKNQQKGSVILSSDAEEGVETNDSS